MTILNGGRNLLHWAKVRQRERAECLVVGTVDAGRGQDERSAATVGVEAQLPIGPEGQREAVVDQRCRPFQRQPN